MSRKILERAASRRRGSGSGRFNENVAEGRALSSALKIVPRSFRTTIGTPVSALHPGKVKEPVQGQPACRAEVGLSLGP